MKTFEFKDCWSNNVGPTLWVPQNINGKVASIMRPCKIWAPYSGHCIEKCLAPKSKYVDAPKQGKISVSVIPFQWCKSFGMVLFVMVTKGFMSRNREKVHVFGAVKLHCLSSHNNFFLKFFGRGITPGCSEMLGPSAFR